MLFAIDPPRPTNSNSNSQSNSSGESSIDHDTKLPSSSLSSRRQPLQTQQQTHSSAESHTADTTRASATDPQHQDETHTLLLAAPAISVSNSRAGGLPVASLWPSSTTAATGPGFHRTNTNSTTHTTTSTADAVSVVSASSNSNISASSIHATPSTGSTTALLVTAIPPLMPMNNHNNTNNTSTRNYSNHSRSNHSRSSVNTTTMNVEAMMNRNTSAGSITSMASFPPAQPQPQSDEANPFPTLLQVRQQSQSHLERRRMLLLTDDQKATLDRVTRLSARMLGLPVAIISGMMMENSTSTTASPQVLSEHGLNEVPWREQALALLRQQQQQPQQQGMPFCEHVPLVHVASTQPQVVVGTLSLMGLQARSALSKDEQESLQDLAFLATQVLSSKRKGSHHRREFTPSLPTGSSVQRQVSNASSSDLRQVQQQHTPTPPPPPPRRRRSMRSKKRSSFNANASQDRMDYRSDDDQHDEDDFGDDDDENDYYQDDDDPSKCIIACTAHDLLTPLMGLQLSLSLLQDDAKFVRHLEEQPHQRESFWTAWQSTEVMFRMCQTTIDSLRANKHAQQQQAERRRRRCVDASRRSPTPPPPVVVTQVCKLDLTVLLQSLQRLMDPIPKQVPLIITLPKHVPTLVPVITTMTQQQQPESTSGSQQQHYLISNNNSSSTATSANSVDWNILRCALTVLSHACRSSHQQQHGGNQQTQRPRKPIHMRMALERNDGQQRDEMTQYRLVIECDHECPPPQDQGDDDDDQQQQGEEEEDSTTLALQSVAHQMQSVHGGRHGFARCDDDASRAVFWFSVPVGDDLSAAKYNRDDRVVTLMPPPPPQQQQQPQSSQQQPLSQPSPATTMMRSRMAKPESPPPTIHEQKQQRGGLFSTSPKNTSPGRPRSGLRRLRRSSTGSTNTLGSRVRTFHDMAGLHNETYGRAGAVGNRGMTTSTSTTRFGTTIPSVLPTTLLPRSQSQYPARSTPLTSLSGHKRNFQYPRSSVTNNNNGSGNATTSTTTTTANTAMAAAFQASLSASVAASAFLVASTSGMDDSSTVDRAARSRLSYSLLQEQQQLDREKLRPMHLQSSARQSSTASQTQPGGHASSTSSSGLDRCFQDLMGNSDQSTQRVRERLLSSTTGTSATTSVVGTPKPTSKPVLSTPASLLLSPNNSSNAGAGRERKALVIEDSLVIRKTVARALTKKMGIQTVVQACDGVEGVARLKEDVFDIVLCDFSMPNLGGIECVQQYRQWEKEQSFSSLMSSLNRPATANRPRQYIVGMSAHASPSDIAQGLKVGMNEYRPKPLTIPRLTELMESPPLQEMRKQLDAWAQKQTMGDTIIGSPSASKVQRKESLFADFTSSTVSMLDAMNSTTARPTPFSATMVGTGSHSSGGSMSRPLDGGGSMKRPKTEGLFSMITN